MRQNLHVRHLVLVLLIAFITLIKDDSAGVFTNGGPPKIAPDGGMLVEGGSVIPPFPAAGKWTELEAKSSERYEIRHFIYLVPNASPAIELFVTVDRHNDAPDGIFEIGLVGGYVKGFAAKAGLKYGEPAFEEHSIGQARAKRTLVRLLDERRLLWVYAYVFLRQPSLTFIAISTSGTEKAEIENYLAGIEFK